MLLLVVVVVMGALVHLMATLSCAVLLLLLQPWPGRCILPKDLSFPMLRFGTRKISVEENHKNYDSESGPMARIPRVFRRHSFPCSAFAIFVQTAHCFEIPAILSAFSSVRPNVIRGAPIGRGCWTHEVRNFFGSLLLSILAT